VSLTARILIWLAIAAAAVGLVAGTMWAYEQWRGSVLAEGDARGAARVQAGWDEERALLQLQANEDARRNAAETERRLKAQERNQRAQDVQLAKARDDAARAAAAADRLQLRAAAYLDAAGCGALAGDPALECVRKAAAAIGDALARSGAIARRAAADADEARSRGLKCEADYDALTLKATPP
jgi:hypothetical protein